MATIYDKLDDKLIEFIKEQPLFFVATVPKDGRINLSPKGLDSLRILSSNKVAYLNLTGSGNETSAHLLEDDRMTMMFCSFTRTTNIVRLYGTAVEIIPEDGEFQELYDLFPDYAAPRQIYVLDFDTVQVSCGYGVPVMTLDNDRDTLDKYMVGLGPEGVDQYKQKKNLETIDGLRTRLPETD